MASDPWDLSEVAPEQVQAVLEQPLRWQDLDWFALLFGHWHNRLVAFPLVLGVVASVMLAPRRPELQAPARWTLISGALLTLLAVLTGLLQKAPFEQGNLRDFLTLHNLLGTATAAVWVGLAALAVQRPQSRWLPWSGLPLGGLTLFTAFVGGILGSH